MFLLLSNTQQNLLLLIKNHNLDTILWISANKVFYIVLYLALKTTKIKQDFTLTLDTYNKNGVLWSQARMRIEMRLKCYSVIGNLQLVIGNRQ